MHAAFGDWGEVDQYCDCGREENVLSGGAVGRGDGDAGDRSRFTGVLCGGGGFEEGEGICASWRFV